MQLSQLNANNGNSISDFVGGSTGSTNYYLINRAKELKFKNFRGVFMRDELKERIKKAALKPFEKQESGIMNFDVSSDPGSHWVAWYKDCENEKNRPEKLYYFDSYGTAVPDELREYLCYGSKKIEFKKNTFENKKILRSDFMIQEVNSDICG